MTYYAKEEDFEILLNAKIFEFIQKDDLINYEIKCDIKESQKKIDTFAKVSKYFNQNRELWIDCVLASYFSNVDINELNVENCPIENSNIVNINCSNNKKMLIKFESSKKIEYILNKIIEWKNYNFWKKYDNNKNKINNIIFLESKINSYVTYVENDNNMPEGNNLYISINNCENSINLRNNDLGSIIIDNFYNLNKDHLDGINYNDKNTILKFDNNTNIYICNGYYSDFINMVENDLIDKKIGKVYKKGD